MRSPSNGLLVGGGNKCNTISRSQDMHTYIVMGPVVASLVLYATERLLSRIMAGQIHRKGLSRKMRRLTSMMTTQSILVEILSDFLEELSDFLAGCV